MPDDGIEDVMYGALLDGIFYLGEQEGAFSRVIFHNWRNKKECPWNHSKVYIERKYLRSYEIILRLSSDDLENDAILLKVNENYVDFWNQVYEDKGSEFIELNYNKVIDLFKQVDSISNL